MEAIIKAIKDALEAEDPSITIVEVKRMASDQVWDIGNSLTESELEPQVVSKSEVR